MTFDCSESAQVRDIMHASYSYAATASATRKGNATRTSERSASARSTYVRRRHRRRPHPSVRHHEAPARCTSRAEALPPRRPAMGVVPGRGGSGAGDPGGGALPILSSFFSFTRSVSKSRFPPARSDVAQAERAEG